MPAGHFDQHAHLPTLRPLALLMALRGLSTRRTLRILTTEMALELHIPTHSHDARRTQETFGQIADSTDKLAGPLRYFMLA